MGRIRDRTQLLGTGRWHTRPGTYHGFSSETPRSPSTYQIHRLWHHSFSNTIISSAGTSLPWRGGGCKGTLILVFFTDRISLPHDSGHIQSMQHPIRPTTSSVKQPTPCPSPPWWLVWLWDGSVMGTRKCTPNTSEPYSVICHCCSYHHCCAITIIIPSIVLSCI